MSNYLVFLTKTFIGRFYVNLFSFQSEMKHLTHNKSFFYIFLLFLLLLFWNPLSFYLFFNDTELIYSRVIISFFTLLFLISLFFIILFIKGKAGEKSKNFTVSFSVSGIFIAILVIINFLLAGQKGSTQQDGLIFQPNTTVRQKTTEFDFMVYINSLGLRDKEISTDKGKKFRILCFGDSWTYGQGVNIEDTWPKKLEYYLHAHGYHNAEVINCGQPGKYPTAYVENMKKILPVLKPDLVLAGILQADDLVQLYENNFNIPSEYSGNQDHTSGKKFLKDWGLFIKYSFGNIINRAKTLQGKSYMIKADAKPSAIQVIEKYSRLQKLRFCTLDDTVKSMILNGDLSVVSLDYYINFPDRMVIINNPQHPATRFAAGELDKDIKSMKELCIKNNCRLVFVNLPMNILTGHKVIRTPSDIMDPYFMEYNHIDSIYRSVAEKNGLPYIELTQHFKDLKEKTSYFFKYDGHPNKNGYREIGYYTAEQLISKNLIDFNF